jgi:hypothetical protein
MTARRAPSRFGTLDTMYSISEQFAVINETDHSPSGGRDAVLLKMTEMGGSQFANRRLAQSRGARNQQRV